MVWHRVPKDDAWKQVHLDYVAGLGVPLWIHCACGHQKLIDPMEFAAAHKLDRRTPLLRISQAMRCKRCGERKVSVWSKPYGIGDTMGE